MENIEIDGDKLYLGEKEFVFSKNIPLGDKQDPPKSEDYIIDVKTDISGLYVIHEDEAGRTYESHYYQSKL